ncbi:MAG: hypothetical protein HWN68_18850, partial [Desulfobacterales bacterium]|nr:hypothetical protein [Desulfobacterales bacterium]
MFKILDNLTTHYTVGLVSVKPMEDGWIFSSIYERSWYSAYWIQNNIWIGHVTTFLMAVGYAAVILYARRKTLSLWEKNLGIGRSCRMVGIAWDLILAGF